MSKYEKFSEFVQEYVIWPLALAFLAIIGSVFVVMWCESFMWAIYTALIISAIAGVWTLLWAVCRTIDDILWKKACKEREAEYV